MSFYERCWLVASLYMKLSNINKANHKGTDQTAQMRGWSAPLLFANPTKTSFLTLRSNITHLLKFTHCDFQ